MNVPKLRFKGFKGEWKKKKLREVADIIGGGTPKTTVPEYWDGEIDWYSPSEIGNQIYLNHSKRKITELGLQKSSARMLPVGTILFTSRAGIGNTAILAKEATTNQGFQSIVPNKNKLDTYFIYSRSHELKRYGEINGAGSTFIEVSGKQMEQMLISLPEIKEQQKIGLFFEKLDRKIQLQQEKIDLLQKQKKGFLQKMFPKAGESQPEWRFDGFYGEWKEIKIGDLAQISRGASPRPIQDPQWFDETSNIGWLRISDVTKQNGRIHHLEQKLSKLGQQKTRVIEKPHLLLSIAATVGKPVINYIPTGVHDGFLIFYTPLFDIEYMFQWLEMFRNNWRKYGQPGSQVNLNSELVRNQKIIIPSIIEQEKIARFLAMIDKKIRFEEEKLMALQQKRQGFMQQMFI